MNEFKYSIEYDGSNRKVYKLYCVQCGKEYWTPKHMIGYRTCCSAECARKIIIEAAIIKNDLEYEKYIMNWKNGIVSGSRGDVGQGQVSNHIRRYLFEKYDCKCCECGWAKINPTTGKIPLEIEHIDGDSSNHKEENLKLLCPNCHSLTATYKSLNNGNGRPTRKLKRHIKEDEQDKNIIYGR